MTTPLRRRAAALLLAAVALALPGCAVVGDYVEAARGHLDLMTRARPVTDWLADDATPARLRARLELAQRMRRFAVDELKLPDNASYSRYADLGRPAAVWNVVATPELSLALHRWCFVVVGCVGYHGHYDRARAGREADALRAQGMDVLVYAVPAYSTLGWSNWFGGDPLLNTFIDYPEGELARLIFHELAHQEVYVADDTGFNEAFATAVGRIGGERWLAGQADADARAAQAAADARRADVRALSAATRDRLAALYASDLADAAKRDAKRAIFERLRAEHAALKRDRWGGYTGYDRWVAEANNAALAVQGAYDDLAPHFERLYQREGRDPARFYAAVRRLAALPKDERHATLRAP